MKVHFQWFQAFFSLGIVAVLAACTSFAPSQVPADPEARTSHDGEEARPVEDASVAVRSHDFRLSAVEWPPFTSSALPDGGLFGHIV